MHEQALAYLTAPEQADAQAGTLLGVTGTWRFTAAGVIVTVLVTSTVDMSETVRVVR
jgi:hypothetical protein